MCEFFSDHFPALGVKRMFPVTIEKDDLKPKVNLDPQKIVFTSLVNFSRRKSLQKGIGSSVAELGFLMVILCH